METSNSGKNENKRKTSHDSKEIIVTESRKLLKTSSQENESSSQLQTTTNVGKRCLLDLDDDALATVLLWTNASDHPNLHCTCKRLHEILSKPSFIKSRCDGLFAQVSVTVRDQKNDDMEEREEELRDENGSDYEYNMDEDASFNARYDEYGCYIGEYGETWFGGTIYVDNIQAGSFSVQILPLSSRYDFHEMADSISGELQYLSVLFFNYRGKPNRVKSVKTAYNVEMSQRGELYSGDENRLAYIKTFALNTMYKDSTFVGASAVREIMECRPLWKHNSSDEQVLPLPRWSLAMYIPDKKNYDEKSGADGLVKSIFDMKNFLRAGFHQAKEVVKDATCHFVYCTPISLKNTKILTDEEMDKIEIISKKPKPTMPKYAKDLLDDVTQTCDNLHQLREEFARCQQLLEQHQDGSPEIQRVSQRLEQLIPQLENRIQIHKNDLRSKIERYVSEHGYEIVMHSSGLHCCSAYLNEDVANILLSFVPREHKRVVINGFDKSGGTPLMMAARGGITFADAKLKHATKVAYIEFLLSNDASLTIVDSDGNNALKHYQIHHRDSLYNIGTFTPELLNIDEMNDNKTELETLLRP